MKITDILNEAKFAKQIVAYHATTLNNLRSIIKQGLIPNYSKDGYGSDEQTGFGIPLDALPGVYLTKLYKNAEYIAKSLYGEPIVLICKVQYQQADWDEDRLVSNILLDDALYTRLYKLSERLPNPSKDKLMQAKDQHLDNIFNTFIPEKLRTEKLKQLLDAYFTELTEAFIDHNYLKKEKIDYIKSLQNKFTKSLRLMLRQQGGPYDVTTFKIDSPIKFSGANKIVGIYSVYERLGWGDLGEFSGYAYHTYKTPIELLTVLMKNVSMKA